MIRTMKRKGKLKAKLLKKGAEQNNNKLNKFRSMIND